MHTCALGRCQLGHPGLWLLSDESGMVVAANLPKMACQLSCGFVCAPCSGGKWELSSASQSASASSQKQGVPAKDLALLDLVLGACLTPGWDLGGGVGSYLETARTIPPPYQPLPAPPKVGLTEQRFWGRGSDLAGQYVRARLIPRAEGGTRAKDSVIMKPGRDSRLIVVQIWSTEGHSRGRGWSTQH